MKIAMIASGSRGDVQPYVALGKGLVRAGHEVRVATHEDFKGLVTEAGLEFFPVVGKIAAIVQGQEMRDLVEGGNFLSMMSEMAKLAKQGAIHLAKAGLAASQGADLIVAGMGGDNIGVALAEKQGIPFIPAYLVPFTTTSEFPSVLTASLPPMLGLLPNRFTHKAAQQLMWQGFRGADKVARVEVLGLPPAPLMGPKFKSGTPVLYGFSPAVVSPPADWGKHIQVTGYWFLDAATDWQPPEDLVDFIENGAPPIYIGFGSLSNRDPRETANLVISALAKAEQRAVLMSGWGGMDSASLPGSVYMLPSVPHDWLFPRMAAVVHHGGVGTTAAGLRAGVPSVVIPFFGDQPFWGQRIYELGVGPEPIPRKKLTVERLAAAISRAVTDSEMRRKAASLGEQIRVENGVSTAVEILENLD